MIPQKKKPAGEAQAALTAMRTMRPTLLLLSASLLAVSPAAASPATTLAPAVTARLDGAATRTLKASGTPSASIAVVQDGRIVYAHAYGLAQRDPARAATTATRYQVASLSKEFTAACLLLLQRDGRLSLDDSVAKYLPDLTDSGHITIRQLLGHVSGYQDFWPQDYVMAPMTRPTTPDAIIAGWAKKPLDFQPGDAFQYSNTGYVVAGRIIEIVTGRKLFDVLRERVFTPLHMDDVMDAATTPRGPSDAVGYERAALGPLRPAPIAGPGWLFAAAELTATASDIARWDAALLNHTLLSADSERQMTTSARLNSGKPTGYGLGLFVDRQDGRTVWSHTGEGAGFLADNRIYPDERTAIVVLTNTLSSEAFEDIADQLEAILLPPSGADAKARSLFAGLQRGAPDRAAFTPNFNAYLDAATVETYRHTLGPLGEPTVFRQTHENLRGGMDHRIYRIVAGGRTLTLSVFAQPDGRIEQFLVQAVG